MFTVYQIGERHGQVTMEFKASFLIKKDADNYLEWRGGDWILREKETGMTWGYGNASLTVKQDALRDLI